MRLTKDGNVGINTTVPQSLLDVQGPVGTGATSAGILTLSTKELTIIDDDQLGRINFNSPLESDGSDAILAGAGIWAEAEATFSATVNSTALVFGTATTSAAVERMRIESSGNVGIGTTDPINPLDVVGIISSSDVAGGSPRIAWRQGSTLGGADNNYAEILIDGAGGTDDVLFRTYYSSVYHNIWQVPRDTENFIVPSGNVGIGTSVPASKLDILSTGTFAAAGVSGITQRAHTVTLSGADPTTYATFYGAQIGAMTLVGTNINQTVTDAAGLIVANPIKSTKVAVTNTHGILVPATAVSTATNSYGLTVNAQTGATNNYAAAFVTGNVGIGTTAPGGNLHIKDNSGAGYPEVLVLEAEDASDPGYRFKRESAGTSGDYYVRLRGSPGRTWLALYSNSGTSRIDEQLNIHSNGNVGLATTAPDARLEINHTTGDVLRLTYNDSDGSATNYTDFSLASDGDLTVDSSGGNINLSDDLAINGGDLTTNQTTFNLVNATATTVNFAGAAGTLNIGPGAATATSVNLAGGSGATGCTVDGATGNFTCSCDITSTATSGDQGWWNRTGTA